MAKLTVRKTGKKSVGKGEHKARARRLAESLLTAMEEEMARGVAPGGEPERLFGTRGVMAQLPKLVQVLAALEEAGDAPEEAAEADGLSDEDIRLLREWMAQRGDQCS